MFLSEITDDGEFITINWEHTGDLSQLSHYIVYRKISNDTVKSYYTTNTQISIKDEGNDKLVANGNVVVAAFRKTDEPNGLVVYLPTISNQGNKKIILLEKLKN